MSNKVLLVEIRDDALNRISGGSEVSTGNLILAAILLAILIGLIVWMTLWWKAKQRHSQAPIGEEQTFQRLCEVSDLTKGEAYLLRKVVFDTQLQNPIDIFVDSRILEEYAGRIGGNKAALVKNVKNKLFV